jgi:hypothetical protein
MLWNTRNGHAKRSIGTVMIAQKYLRFIYGNINKHRHWNDIEPSRSLVFLAHNLIATLCPYGRIIRHGSKDQHTTQGDSASLELDISLATSLQGLRIPLHHRDVPINVSQWRVQFRVMYQLTVPAYHPLKCHQSPAGTPT